MRPRRRGERCTNSVWLSSLRTPHAVLPLYLQAPCPKLLHGTLCLPHPQPSASHCPSSHIPACPLPPPPQVRIAYDRDTGRARGFAHVQFEELEGAAKAVQLSGQVRSRVCLPWVDDCLEVA